MTNEPGTISPTQCGEHDCDTIFTMGDDSQGKFPQECCCVAVPCATHRHVVVREQLAAISANVPPGIFSRSEIIGMFEDYERRYFLDDASVTYGDLQGSAIAAYRSALGRLLTRCNDVRKCS
jgi:hypothetical protein